MVLGIYYLSMERQEKHPEYLENADGTKVERLPRFSDMAEGTRRWKPRLSRSTPAFSPAFRRPMKTATW